MSSFKSSKTLTSAVLYMHALLYTMLVSVVNTEFQKQIFARGLGFKKFNE